ncbi:DHA2 family efflux MFS transporter permease subunit [bacterium]|nr:DHA2 family efflux MFS transporter permease subunit [bacterium]
MISEDQSRRGKRSLSLSSDHPEGFSRPSPDRPKKGRPSTEVAPVWKPKWNPWIIAIAVMSATFMEVLDTSISNVALPHIGGSLAATTEESTWMVTSYLVSNAIVLPLTGWISSTFGRKNFLLVCIAIFTLASVLSGAAQSLNQLILFRILQGLGGGAMQPTAQAILFESFPPEKRGQAMAFYGMGIVVAPILGPIVGGWLTDNYSWRWTFYINLPVGILASFLVYTILEDPPYLKEGKTSSVDLAGFFFLVIWVGALQIMLDKGQLEDWFESPLIVVLCGLFVVFLVLFVVWESTRKSPIVDLSIFKDRTFALSTLLITMVGGVLYGTLTLGPLFLQQLRGYPAFSAGLAVAPRGLGAMSSMMIVGALLARFDGRFFVCIGFCVLSYSNHLLGQLNMNTGVEQVVMPNVLAGVGMGLVFVPLATIANDKLPARKISTASGVFNLMRNLGGGVGIAMSTTMLSRGGQFHQARLTEHVNIYNPALTKFQLAAQGALGDRWLVGLAATVARQASMLSYVDAYTMMSWVCLGCAPLVFLLSKPSGKGGGGAGMH